MAVTIEQKPLYDVLPIGQQIMFAISMNTIVATKFKVKFVAEVYVGTNTINLSNTSSLIGTYKTTPNNKGVGIFDLRPILETFVSPDNLGSTSGNGSKYKTTSVTHPLHLIDKISRNDTAMRYFAVKFKVEYADSSTGNVNAPNNATDSVLYQMFNGVLHFDDILTLSNNNYGYNLDTNKYYPFPTADAKFLTTAPTTQYASLNDYGTFAFLNGVPTSADFITKFVVTYYWDGGSSSEDVAQSWTNGGDTSYHSFINTHLLYFGGYPGNLQNWSSTFASAVTSGLTHYTIQSRDEFDTNVGELYTINIICDNFKGFEPIRLTWLNQWGVWDYYTFNRKSIKSIKTKRTSYTQTGGTWNESTFKINGYKGGKKSFRVNSTELIKVNSDFLTEAESVWFEELINSTEVYILKGFSADVYQTITNKYVEPVTLKTSSYIRKTVANDKLIQYTLQIQKSKMPRTQSV
jgi:hypothetical protein|tara:strand:- start:719 stop:2107 length:1389 start_codon:yes stop_codon:yes gene_type:complete